MVDVGAGTMDILFYDTESGLHYKAVARSPVPYLAGKAAALSGPILLTGYEMGGGAITQVLKEKARKEAVVMSTSAAATIHHNRARVRDLGITIIEDKEAEDLRLRDSHSHLFLSDLELDRLASIINGIGIPFSFDVVGICAQDHGVPPEGMSHLDYRHHIFEKNLDGNPFPHALLYRDDEIPETMNRLTSIAQRARMLPADEIYVMDSGMAAILGASMDARAHGKEKILLMDVATSHTLGAAMEGSEIAGFFEYHTSDITCERLESLLIALADGKLEHGRILEEGGHGAYIRKAVGMASVEAIIATGPKRSLIRDARLPIVFGAPIGDNMMTGTVGLLEAVRRRKNLEPFPYL
jgi:uncharacterized protein (DUF1786 family)